MKTLIFIIFVYIVITASLYFFADKLIFPYRQSSYNSKLDGLFFITTVDKERIAVRLWRAINSNYLVIYLHGNGEDIGHLDLIADRIVANGYSVLSFDYRGYGLSTGKPTESNTYADLEMVLAYAKNLGYSAQQIIVWGRSLGSGLAVHLAKNHALLGMVLESPFKSIYTVVTKYPIIFFDKFNNKDKLTNVKNIPLYIIHGAKDNIIPVAHGRQLFAIYNGRKCLKIIDNANHNDLMSFGLLELIPHIMNFVTDNNALHSCVTDN